MLTLALAFVASLFLLEIPGIKGNRRCRHFFISFLFIYETILAYIYVNNPPLFAILLKVEIVIIAAIFVCAFMIKTFDENQNAYSYHDDNYELNCHLTAFSLYQSYEPQIQCAICHEDMEPLQRHPSLYLLKCGHMFHRRCLRRDERRLWRMEDHNIRRPYGRCPICMTRYNTNWERFKYNEFRKYFHECTELERAMVGRGFFGLEWHFDRDYGFFAQFPRFVVSN